MADKIPSQIGWLATASGAVTEPISARKTLGFESGAAGYKPKYNEFNWFWRESSRFQDAVLDGVLQINVDASSGDDSNDGSASAPLENLTTALKAAIPGIRTEIILSDENHDVDEELDLYNCNIEIPYAGSSCTITFKTYYTTSNNIYGVNMYNTTIDCEVDIITEQAANAGAFFAKNYCFGFKSGLNYLKFADWTNNTTIYGGSLKKPCLVETRNSGFSLGVVVPFNSTITTNSKGYVAYVSDYGLLVLHQDVGSLATTIDTEYYWVSDIYRTGGIDDVQKIYFPTVPTSGTFTLSVNSDTTGAIAATADASSIQTEVEALSGISTAEVVVSKGTAIATIMDIKITVEETPLAQWEVDVSSLGGVTDYTVTRFDFGREAKRPQNIQTNIESINKKP